MKYIAVQADHLASLNLQTDSSVLIAAELQRRGFKVFWYHPRDLKWENGDLMATGYFVDATYAKKLHDDIINLASAEVLLVRQNPPFDEAYLANTYMLETLPESCVVINHPKAIRDCSEKLSALHFPHLIPPTVVSANQQDLMHFLQQYREVVIKPLFGFGGMDVRHLNVADIEVCNDVIQSYLMRFKTCIIQQYLPAITREGDRRVFIVAGKILGGIKRRPTDGSILAGIAAGGEGSALDTLTETEQNIALEVAVWLHKKNIFMAGIDIIDGNLIEINVTSPTGFKLFNTLNPHLRAIEVHLVDEILKEKGDTWD